MHHVSKQGATLHGRGKHGEAAQARCMGKKRTRRVMNRQKCDAGSCYSSVRPRGDRFSACWLSENVMHIASPLHTASRGSSRVGAALGSD